MTLRVGIGHDTHRLGPGECLRIGGIDIPHDRQALGHSDADVLLHALTDAILGAVAAGDIGELFPDTDPDNRGRDSADFLQAARERAAAAGYAIVNVDCILFVQKPKLSPYKQRIARRLAELLGVSAEQVNIKAKTGEGVDAVGREEAISAQCVVLLEKP
ncbi:MAG TPA: 2-C-methyl-D-erythritol 2,4-cyclodiphosphate synthase [Pirellulales bacterium]|nr:2-C-methyl-D-erythritol 2,4-cyclodiphosphate synthase [Pirellulales bacterium]